VYLFMLREKIMSTTIQHITCPKCGKTKPNNPKIAGKKIVCPSCKTTFTAPLTHAKVVATEPEIYYSISRKKLILTIGGFLLTLLATASVLFFVILSRLPSSSKATNQQSNQNGVANTIAKTSETQTDTQKRDAINVTAKEIFDDYSDTFSNRNVAQADAKYLDKSLRITGKVLKIEKVGSNYWVGFETGPNVIPVGSSFGSPGSSFENSNVIVLKAGIVAEIPESDREIVAKIKEFDTITIVGVCQGKKSDRDRMGKILVLLKNSTVEAHTPQ
jgi:hypothetical protein